MGERNVLESGIHPSCLAVLPPRVCGPLTSLVSRLAAALGPRLVGVQIYGSAARFEHHPRYSDLNLLLVLDPPGPMELGLAGRVLARAPRSLRLRPVALGREQLGDLPAVFPLESLEIRAYHLNIYGPDLAESLLVDPKRLAAEAPRHLAQTIVRLRNSYLRYAAQWRSLAAALVESVPAVMALLHAALYSRQVAPARHYLQLVGQAAGHFGLDRQALVTPLLARRGERRLLGRRRQVVEAFWAYLGTLETLSERLARGGEP